MERYNKYLVLKIADIKKYLSDEKQLKLDALVTCIRVGRLNDGKRDQEYVCVAADWPMHEQVWGMVEAFVDGKPNEIEQLTARVAELEAENAKLHEQVDLQVPKMAFTQLKAANDAQAAVIEKLREALLVSHDLSTSTITRLLNAIHTDSTQILDEVRRAERERVAQFVDDNCTYGDTHILVKAIRAMA